MKERWKQIFGGRYQISSEGRILGPSGRVLKPRLNKPNGYLYVKICSGGIRRNHYVSRLVCQAFHGPPPGEDSEADHRNTVRTDNRAKNLRWLPLLDNRALRKFPVGERHWSAKLAEAAALSIKQSTLPTSALAEQFGVKPRTIRDVRNGVTWAHLEKGTANE
jgi:hypothetical protein